MPPESKAASIVSLVDKLNALIRDVPKEHLDDVEGATTAFFQLRRELLEDADAEEAAGGESENGEKPLKRRKLKEGERGMSGLEDLNVLRTWLRQKVPADAVLATESLHYNPTGDFKNCTAANTVSVDSFLWDEADVDELCDEGKLPRNVCLECGSKKTVPMNFVSHSFSIAELNFIFTKALPSAGGIKGELVVDVGSRLGCAIYAAVVLGDAGEAVGVELNRELCDLQTAAFEALGAVDRVKVVCGDIADQEELLGKAKLVVLHNPFHFFQDLAAACALWKKIAQSISPGALVIASPPLSEQLLQASDSPPIDLESWVERLKLEYPQAEDPDDEHADDSGLLYSSIELYRVRARLGDVDRLLAGVKLKGRGTGKVAEKRQKKSRPS